MFPGAPVPALLPLVPRRRGRAARALATADDARRRFRALLAPTLVIIAVNFAGAAAWRERASVWRWDTFPPLYNPRLWRSRHTGGSLGAGPVWQ